MQDKEDSLHDGMYLADFEKRYRRKARTKGLWESCNEWLRKSCSKQVAKKSFLGNFPFLKIMRDYKLQYVPNDVIAGTTVGIMHIPQGMAYGTMASLPPICGLYTSLFGPLTYFFFGSSKHVSMGTIVVVSLMIAAVLDTRLAADDVMSPAILNKTLNATFTDLEIDHERAIFARKIQIATALSFVSGIAMMLLGKLGVGFVTSYMSEYLIKGFTTGIAIHAVSSQMKNILGLKVKRFNGAFKVIKTWVEVFQNITDITWVTFGTSVVSMVIIYVIKTQINERFKHKLRMPIPIELIVVILGTVVSHFGQFNANFDVKVVGEIPAGIPAPIMPDIRLVTSHIGDAVMIGIIAFAQSVSLAKSIAIKNRYPVDTNQEMFAYGTGSVLCSIFSGYIPAASLARSTVQDGTGGITQVASLASCCVVLVVVMAVGPLFYNLPACVLSSVIFINLKGMFYQTVQLRPLWRQSKWDFSIWILTLTCVVLLDADVGLAIGVAFSIFTVVCRTQRSGFVSKGEVDATKQYRSNMRYDHVRLLENVKILSFEAPLYFANSELFVSRCYLKCGINPLKLQKNSKYKTRNKNDKTIFTAETEDAKTVETQAKNSPIPECGVLMETNGTDSDSQYLILDMSNVLFMDTMGVRALERVVSEMESVDINVFIVRLTEEVIDVLQSTGFTDKHRTHVYMDVKDVLATIHIDTSQSKCG